VSFGVVSTRGSGKNLIMKLAFIILCFAVYDCA